MRISSASAIRRECRRVDLPAHVHDQRFRALCLDFKGGDEGVFRVFSFNPTANCNWTLQDDSSLLRLRRGRS